MAKVLGVIWEGNENILKLWQYITVNTLKATELYTQNGRIICYMYSILIRLFKNKDISKTLPVFWIYTSLFFLGLSVIYHSLSPLSHGPCQLSPTLRPF